MSRREFSNQWPLEGIQVNGHLLKGQIVQLSLCRCREVSRLEPAWALGFSQVSMQLHDFCCLEFPECAV